MRVTRGRRLRCGSAETGTSGERACRGRPRRGGSAQRQEGGAAVRGSWRSAEGRGGERAGPAARATCGAGWLPHSGDTVSPREFGSARASAHTGSHPHTPERAIITAAAPAGQRELLQFP